MLIQKRTKLGRCVLRNMYCNIIQLAILNKGLYKTTL